MSFMQGSLERHLDMNSAITFLEWVARKITRLTAITHYLDDFLIVGPAGSEVCATTLAQFKDTMAHFGVPLSPEKTIGPVSVITFLGIEIDSVAMEFRLPKEKIDKLLDLISGKWNEDPTLIDLLPVAVAMEVWGSQLANKRICLQLETVGGAHAINYLASPSPLVLDLIRFIVLKCLTFNVWFKAYALTVSNENVYGLLTGSYSQDLLGRRLQEPLEEVDCPHSIWDVLGT
ncbi:unnamed protein product [Ranitomeya imitator]|uniref:Reverse transcriptase domain-containing protein n=1 Tax=Ranitomeya imitator TaxID=111125 RepID=A0ABN9LPV1_9NEOB|nr:unnamed protein product [Ranitomeya imitator]